MKNSARFYLILTAFITGLFPLMLSSQNFTDTKGLKQGLWEETDGSFISKGKYTDDKKDGTWVVYISDLNRLQKVESYNKGKKDGVFLEFSKRSTLISEQYFVNDLPDGPYRTFSNSGLILTENYYRLGKMDGLQSIYYENTMDKKSEEIMYKNGLKDGLSKWFDMMGNLIAEYNYRNGNLEGEQKAFYPDGKLRSSDMYVNNLSQGNSVEYYENGNVKVMGQYVNGEKDGKWTEFDENGKAIKTTVYSKGKIK